MFTSPSPAVMLIVARRLTTSLTIISYNIDYKLAKLEHYKLKKKLITRDTIKKKKKRC